MKWKMKNGIKKTVADAVRHRRHFTLLSFSVIVKVSSYGDFQCPAMTTTTKTMFSDEQSAKKVRYSNTAPRLRGSTHPKPPVDERFKLKSLADARPQARTRTRGCQNHKKKF